jgi:cytochrome c oxidase subunit 3
MFFFGFFWAFFHSAVSPVIQIGAVWPPIGVEFITVKGFAIANTVILLTSGATLTVAHYAFELIPQRRNKLFLQQIPFTDSVESFEIRLQN